MTPPLLYLAAGVLLGCIGMGLFAAVCARNFVQGLREELITRLQSHEQSLHKALTERVAVPTITPDFEEARITLRVQQAIQVEIEYLAQLQLERDEALAQKQRRWHAEQHAGHANDLRALLEALKARGDEAVAHSVNPKQATALRTASIAPSSVAVSARPPELTHRPLPRPEVAPAPERPEIQLSDEEIDALPPDLPAAGKPRRRVLPAPTKPPLRRI